MDISLLIALLGFSAAAIFFSWRYELGRRKRLQLRKSYGNGVCPVGFWVHKTSSLPSNKFLLGFRNEGGLLWFEVDANVLSDLGITSETLLKMALPGSLYHLSPVGIVETSISRKDFLKQHGEQRPQRNAE